MSIKDLINRILPSRGWKITAIVLAGIISGTGIFTLYIARVHTYLSDDPATCVNCHIMAPYYATWSHSAHSRNATCNDCHVPHDSFARKWFFKLISGEPDVLKSFLAVTGNCNHCTVTRLRILSFKGIRTRFVYYLLENRKNENTSVLLHNQVELAEYLGVSRPALSKEINNLVKEGLISIEKKEVRLLNVGALIKEL